MRLVSLLFLYRKDDDIGDFNAFFPRHSQYLAFFLDDSGLGGHGDKE